MRETHLSSARPLLSQPHPLRPHWLPHRALAGPQMQQPLSETLERRPKPLPCAASCLTSACPIRLPASAPPFSLAEPELGWGAVLTGSPFTGGGGGRKLQLQAGDVSVQEEPRELPA